MRTAHSFIVLLVSLAAACSPTTREGADDDPGSPDDDAGSDFVDAAPPVTGQPDAGSCTEVVDVVFVLDVSSSMGFVLDRLGDEIEAVVDAANALAPDAHFGLVAFADNHALDTSGPLGGGKVHTSAATLRAAFASVQNVYTNHDRNPGDGPSGRTTQNPICEENAPDALHAAATEFPWRDNATRVVIVATDDTFLEPPDNYGDRDHDGDTTSSDYPREGDYPARRSLAATTAALVDARARVFSFTRLEPPFLPELVQCGTGRRKAWSEISDGWSTPYAGGTPLPDATDGRNYDLAAVQEGTLSLSATIQEVVVGSYCNPPVP